jgi:predicted kinase
MAALGARVIRMATLFLTCGLPGSGKTTLAKRLEVEHAALRLTADEWIRALFGPTTAAAEVLRGEAPDERRAAVEAVQWQVAAHALARGVDVVLDWGVWSRSERDDLRSRACAIGARCVVCYQDVPHEELVRRIAARNREPEPESFVIDPEYLALWETWFEAPTEDELRDDGPDATAAPD